MDAALHQPHQEDRLSARCRAGAVGQGGAAVGVDLPMAQTIRSLGVAQQQLVEIVRAISQHGRILVMDEPTARLAPAERAHLFDLMRALARNGAGIVFITHFLVEVAEVADVGPIMRNGRVAAHRYADGFSISDMATMLEAISTPPDHPRPEPHA